MSKPNLRDSLALILDLATQNMLDADEPDMADEAERQDLAGEVVAELIELIDDEDRAEKLGEDLIAMMGLRKIRSGSQAGRVELQDGWGTKTPTGLTRTVFQAFNNYAVEAATKPKYSDITCTLETAPMSGNAYHEVRWTDENGEPQSQTVHGCEDDTEAVCEVLGGEGGQLYNSNS